MGESLAARLNHIIEEQRITKREFARRIGVGETYVYVITGGGRKNQLNQNISPALAKVIGMEFGYDPEWILHGGAAPDRDLERLRQDAIGWVERLGAEDLLALERFLEKMRSAEAETL
jgi:transcriptional regulator with XRE-family HTH domain